MGQIGNGCNLIESNQYRGYDLLYKSLSTDKLLKKQAQIEIIQEKYYIEQRKVKHGSNRFWKIDNKLDDGASKLRAIKKLLGRSAVCIKESHDCLLYSIYSDSVGSRYFFDGKYYKYCGFKISKEDMNDLVENGIFKYED